MVKIDGKMWDVHKPFFIKANGKELQAGSYNAAGEMAEKYTNPPKVYQK